MCVTADEMSQPVRKEHSAHARGDDLVECAVAQHAQADERLDDLDLRQAVAVAPQSARAHVLEDHALSGEYSLVHASLVEVEGAGQGPLTCGGVRYQSDTHFGEGNKCSIPSR